MRIKKRYILIIGIIVIAALWAKSKVNFASENELKNGTVMWPVRIAISGKQTTPGGAVEILEILGKEVSLKRIINALNKL